jgi:hypothetical protein
LEVQSQWRAKSSEKLNESDRTLPGVSADSAREMDYCLEVKGLRKQVHEVHLLNPIPTCEQNDQITRQSDRVAGYINHAWRACW